MSGFSRVSIPDSLRRTIQDIKEITGKHSDEDVYAMLKDCNMDPNETAQKLLYLDTFHEVKRKRDRRKVSVKNRAGEEYQRISGIQRRGARGDNNYSSYNSDAVGGRQLNRRSKNGYSSSTEKASKSSMPLPHKESSELPVATSSTTSANGSTSICNMSSVHVSTSPSAEHNIRSIIKDTKAVYGKKSRKLSPFLHILVPTLGPGPTPAPTPTTENTRDCSQGGSLKPRSSHLGEGVGTPSASGLYSSASDPVLVPSLNPRNPGAAGIIKRETFNQRNGAEVNADLMAGQIMTIGKPISGSFDLESNTPPIDYRSQLDESSEQPYSTSHRVADAEGNPETCSVQQLKGPSKDILSEAAGIVSEANRHSIPTTEDSSLEQETSEVDTKLHKLHISAGQSVIFPNHLHVPEAFKNTLTFGSLDSSLGQNSEYSCTKEEESVPSNIDASKESSPPPKSSPPISGHGGYPDRPPSPSHALANLTSPQENDSSGIAPRYDHPKQEMLQPVGASHNQLLPTMPDYGLSFTPPVVGSHLLQLEGLDSQGGSSLIPSTSSTPYMSQPRGIPQNPISLSSQLFPFLRQPYPPNYLPYSPYFSQLYMPPQNPHQLLNHGNLPHQPSAANIYMPPPPPPPAAAAASAGVKYPIPPVYKPGNLPHYGISSGYGSYGSSAPGYGQSTASPPGTSNSDDIAGSELKEKNMYSSIKQNTDFLPANVFYNPPQGQPFAYSPAQMGHNSYPGIYHPTQGMSTQSLVHQPLQQSQRIGGAVEPILPPLNSYPQPQTQLLPLPQQQYGQMNWNKKLLNRENI